jgi:hypothetical protein
MATFFQLRKMGRKAARQFVFHIFAPFVIIFGATKGMPGLPKTGPFFVAIRAAQKSAILGKAH